MERRCPHRRINGDSLWSADVPSANRLPHCTHYTFHTYFNNMNGLLSMADGDIGAPEASATKGKPFAVARLPHCTHCTFHTYFNDRDSSLSKRAA
jgi:hypothetical protein